MYDPECRLGGRFITEHKDLLGRAALAKIEFSTRGALEINHLRTINTYVRLRLAPKDCRPGNAPQLILF